MTQQEKARVPGKRKSDPEPSGERHLVARSPETIADTIVSLCSLGLVYAVLFSKFKPAYLLSDTILTGGDSASWYQVLATLKNDFLPKGRLFAFSQNNFFGYMEGQHYFVLPFLFAALLGYFVPLTVALKLTTVIGGFALPLTTFIAVTSITGRKRSGAVGAAFSLLFLFNESYTIFGGNWLSTFAGEFCFSWAIALLPLFVASVIKDFRQKRKGIVSGILLGLIGLSHFFVFMPAFFLPFFPAFKLLPRLFGKRKKQRTDLDAASTTARFLSTYLVAFLLMAFWLLPMAASRQWAQPISILWRFSSLKDFARQTLAWVWAPLTLVFVAASTAKKMGKPSRGISAFLAYSLFACAFLFFVAPGLGMPDIRFVPTALLMCVLGASTLLEPVATSVFPSLATRRKSLERMDSAVPAIASFCIVVLCCAISMFVSRNASGWYDWNYSGYEAKAEWPALEELGAKYHGTDDDGRFLWEKQDQRDNKDFGSERAFENLALFTGHPTSEGIHYGSSMMARAATYLQSSYSLNPVDPEAERIYSIVDPESWPARFSLLNAGYIITYSNEITAQFGAHRQFVPDSKIGKFTVFAYKNFPGHYVEILPGTALSIVKAGPGGFRTDYYRFFREYELYSRPFVSSSFADGNLKALLASEGTGGGREWENYDAYRNVVLPQIAVLNAAIDTEAADGGPARRESAAASAIRNEHVDNFSIAFDTESPGKPHYIKISYAPGWKSRNGEKIYPVAPGFMLIIPKTNHVELSYGRTSWEIAGIALSLLFIPAALFLKKFRTKKSFPWKALLIVAFLIFLTAAFFLIRQTSVGYPALARDIESARKQNLSIPLQRDKALSLVEKWATAETLGRFDNMLAFDAFRIKADALLRTGKTEEAKKLIDILEARYPHTRALATLPVIR